MVDKDPYPESFHRPLVGVQLYPGGNRGSAEMYKVGSKIISLVFHIQCLGIMKWSVFYRGLYSKRPLEGKPIP